MEPGLSRIPEAAANYGTPGYPFSRLVHVWSGFASITYVLRPYQLVRARRLNLPEGHNTPRRVL